MLFVPGMLSAAQLLVSNFLLTHMTDDLVLTHESMGWENRPEVRSCSYCVEYYGVGLLY